MFLSEPHSLFSLGGQGFGAGGKRGVQGSRAPTTVHGDAHGLSNVLAW